MFVDPFYVHENTMRSLGVGVSHKFSYSRGAANNFIYIVPISLVFFRK